MRALALLLQLSDSALPTGGFSHSFGFEQYLSRGEVHDANTFSQWLSVFVATQLTYTDALLMRMAYDGVCEDDLADRAIAATLPAQIRTADVAIARRIRKIGEQALGAPSSTAEVAHPALEFARITLHFNVPVDDAILGHLTGTVTTLTQNAVRGIPIGQSDGQQIITAAHAWIERALEEAHTLDYSDLGMVVPGLEIAQMQHERLRARIFMS
ncbi:MAG TPA: urease accessory UreF family protein [Thermomicrobiales bacterium]|nr:urease accessory UreF family protein [Thermomicrobiales bacterium]